MILIYDLGYCNVILEYYVYDSNNNIIICNIDVIRVCFIITGRYCVIYTYVDYHCIDCCVSPH